MRFVVHSGWCTGTRSWIIVERTPRFWGVNWRSDIPFYYVVLGVAAICYFAVDYVSRAPFGLALQGVLTDRDIALRVVAEGRPPTTLVEDVMTEEVVTCRPEDDIRRAWEVLCASVR